MDNTSAPKQTAADEILGALSRMGGRSEQVADQIEDRFARIANDPELQPVQPGGGPLTAPRELYPPFFEEMRTQIERSNHCLRRIEEMLERVEI